MKSYKIGELATTVNLKIDTIRYYEKIELIPAPERQDNGYRIYSEKYVEILEFIKLCKNNGFRLKEIQEIMNLLKASNRDDNELKSVIVKKVNELDAKVEELLSLKNQLNEIYESCNAKGCTLENFLKE